MNLNSFTYVTEIEKCGSINQAAQNLFTSQSNLSTSLKLLEEELGYPIFNRTKNGCIPTSKGYLFIQSAQAILSEIEKISNIAYRSDYGETISLTCNWSAQILKLLFEFKETNNPGARDQFRETSLKQSLECIYENKYRLAIIDCFHSLSEELINTITSTNLKATVLKNDVPAVALMGKSHPLANSDFVTMADIYKYPLVLFEDYNEREKLDIMHLLKKHRIMYVFDRGTIADAVRETDNISIIRHGTYVDIDTLGIVEKPIRDLSDSYDVILVQRNYYEMNNREKEFIELICSQL